MRVTGVLSLLLVTACAGPSAPAPNLNVEDLPTSVTLSVGKHVVVNETRVTFEAVPSDSRCPKDVACVWAGNAELVLRVDPAQHMSWPTYRVVLNSSLEPQTVDLKESIRLTLERLTPEPISTKPTRNYQAQLRISKR